MQDLVDHIDYVVRRIGFDHVGFNSDFFNETLSLPAWRSWPCYT
ncbi:MAG: membrane dipeptidase [Chloroflexota bacterium]